jgi:FkbM family methyltransferase
MQNRDAHLVQTAFGPLWVFRGDRYVSRSLEVYGEYAGDELQMFQQLVRPGMTVVEAGGNIGALCVPLARMCAPGPIYVFEPQQRAIQLLCANLAINGVDNARVFADGLGATPSMIKMPPVDYAKPGNFGSVTLDAAAQQGDFARVSRLDDWPLTACDFIKIDVEGWEAEVLKGARETLARFKPAIYLENDRAEKQAETIAVLDAAGYRMYWHVAPLYRANNFNRVAENIFGATVALNMLALSRDDPRPVSQLEPVDPRSWRSPVRPIGG